MMKQYTRLFFFASVHLSFLECSSAFQMHRKSATPSKIFAENDALPDIDLEIAEECAKNFGKYSIEEIGQCRDELHARRMQNVVHGDGMSPDIMKELFLEEELSLQLDWLKQEMPESYLFPDDEQSDLDTADATNADIDGLRMDNGLIAVDLPPRQDEPSGGVIAETNKNMGWWMDEFAKEVVLESLVICAFLGFLMLSPSTF